ncbi:hypothetical protein PL373_14705 [Tenacibaculum maritimum]|nr:phage tail spike protein [Tenacibaculum maritimum]MDB0602369.1 hypothetical protein [Tenacibaculum maritimum]MDB0613470.1 hypothetical protein [Tenacibaculum maritimum]
MKVYRGTSEIADVLIDDKTQLKQTLQGENLIQANFVLDSFFDFKIGDYINWRNKRYTIFKQPSVKKIQSNNFQYNFDLESDQYRLLDAIYMLDGQADFSLVGDVEKFANLIILNLNRLAGDGYYQLGLFPVTTVKNLNFQNTNCLTVLQQIAKEFDLEYLFSDDGKTIDFKTKIGNDSGLSFEFKNGLRNIERQKINDKNIITRLYAFGGDRNISKNYGSKRLKIDVLEKNTNLFGKIEGVVNFDDIYPHREGTVSSVASDTILKFTDTSLDFDVNNQLIEGTVAKVTFNSGYLAGYELEISEYVHSSKTFTVIAYSDVNGLEFPNDTLKIQPGDKYVLHDIIMPETYVSNAEAELNQKAQDYLDENSLPNVIYNIQPDYTYLRKNLIQLNVGDLIEIKDDDFGITYKTRIISIVQSLANSYKYSIKVGDKSTIGYITQVRNNQIELGNNIRIEREDRTIQYNRVRRNLKNIDELKDAVFDPDGYFDVDKIKPLSIETNMLSVGSKGQQFIIRNLLIEPNYEGNPNKVKCGNGTLVHFTIDPDVVKEWNLTGNIVVLDTPASFYYVYAKCHKTSGNGLFELSTTQYQTNETDYYYFLIGVVHSVVDGVRGVSLTYGQTTINGKFITTGKVQSIDGHNYFDLDGNKWRVGNDSGGIDWNVTNPDKLTIKGGLVQSPAGVEFPIAVFRGEWDNAIEYFKGDQVTYQGSSYMYINDTSSTGNLPTNTIYFEAYALAGQNGASGADGNSVFVQYSIDGSTNWHNTFQATDIYMRQKIGSGTWSSAIRIVGENGQDGIDGANGNNGANGVDGANGISIVWKGAFSSHPSSPQNGWAYYNTSQNKSYVYQDGTWYQMTIDGVDGANGANGNDGVSIEWKGENANPPANPQLNWAYRDTDNGLIYIYNGMAWVLMVRDGNDGADGTDGSNGLSVFITYHGNAVDSQPTTPIGNGTTGGWSTTPSANSNWMSQKVSDSASSGTWSTAILTTGQQGIQGLQGVQGPQGNQGIAGQNGTNGQTSYFHIKYAPVENPTSGQMSETPNAFIGTYVDFTQNDSTNSNDYNWFRFQGLDGTDGIPGEDGVNGQTSYLHIAYADDVNGNGFSQSPNNKEFIGTYTDFNQQDSNDKNDYNWTQLIGASGNFVDYVFKRYPVNFVEDGFVASGFVNNIYTLTGNNPSGWSDSPPNGTDPLWMSKSLKDASGNLIGNWSVPVRISGNNGQNGVNGTDGVPGTDGQNLYTWIKYADDISGSGISNSPTGKDYIGFAYNKTTPLESTTPIDYTWSKIVGSQGNQGVQGADGVNGETYYTWVKYSDNSDGTGLYDTPTANTQYIGISVNNNVQSESSNKADYVWSKFKGEDGTDGADGVDGQDGPGIVYRGIFNQSTLYYNNSIRRDVVKYTDGNYYIYKGTNGVALAWSTSNWETFGAQFDSVATNLLLAENANIADWIIKDGKITSQNEYNGTPRAQFDGANGKITLVSPMTTYTNSGGSRTYEHTLKLDSTQGRLEARHTGDSYQNSGVSYVDSEGVFANFAGTQALPKSSGLEIKGAVVGLGFGKLNKAAYGSNDDAIAGVVGRAYNSASNPAPAFGGLFFGLKTYGLFFNVKTVTGSSHYVTGSEDYISCYYSGTTNIYLPTSERHPGRVIYVKRINGGVRVNGNGVNLLRTSSVSYVDLPDGETWMFMYDGSYWCSGRMFN